MNWEAFVTCAITGAGDTTGKSEHVPVTPHEIADSAIAAARAGAAIVHIHVRDPDTGAGARDPALYAEAVERIRDSGVDVVVNLTAGMGGDLVLGGAEQPLPPNPDGTDMAGATERLAHVREIRPEICTLDCGTMNFASGGDYIMVNSPATLKEMARQVKELGVRPELEVFDTGHLVFVKELVRDGLLDDPLMVQLCMGIAYGAPDDLTSLQAMVEPASGRVRVLGVLDRAHAAPVRGDGRPGRRERARRSRGQPAPRAGAPGDERRAGRPRRVDHRGDERQRDVARRGARQARAGETVSPIPGLSRVALLGGGVIGGGWAARFLLNGVDVTVYDPDPEAARKIGEVLDNARRAFAKLTMAPAAAEGELRFAATPEEAVAGVDFVQESAPERIDLKRAILGRASAAAPPGVVIATSTSGLLPTTLQEGIDHPERLVVGHPFNPVYLLPLVEVCGGAATSTAATQRAAEVYRSLGMRPLILGTEIDGFVADRLLEALWREALWLVHDGVATVEQIDDAIRFGAGLRWSAMGTFLVYRIAGGEAGMRHFMAQFGPALKWPWTKLTDVPELTDELLERIVAQSDEQAGARTIREWEALRDDCLVAVIQGLRSVGYGAGEVLAELRAAAVRPRSRPRRRLRRRRAAANARDPRARRLGGLQRPHERQPVRAAVVRRLRRAAAPDRPRRRVPRDRAQLVHGREPHHLRRPVTGGRSGPRHDAGARPRPQAPARVQPDVPHRPGRRTRRAHRHR